MGSQLYINRGRHSNFAMFLHYRYTMQNNVYNYAIIRMCHANNYDKCIDELCTMFKLNPKNVCDIGVKIYHHNMSTSIFVIRSNPNVSSLIEISKEFLNL